MPKPVDGRARYLAGLDGIRALAVIAVFGYHLGFEKMSGGLLGVGVFFTLSGFLITRILLDSWTRTGSLELGRFWVRRARRLLPALLVVLTVVLAATALISPDQFAKRWGQSWTAALYFANWHTIGAEQSYFDRFMGPGPLDHLWSLSVEEQFYLVWPLVLLVALVLLRASRRALVIGTAIACTASFVALAVLANPGFDNTRAYEGTDTRAGGILVGALLALTWESLMRVRSHPRLVNTGVQVGGIVGLVVIGLLVAGTDDYSMSLYRWGLLLLSVATAALVAAVAWPGSVLNRVLGIAPLRWVGERSYGLYLWQLPVIAAVSTDTVASNRLWWSVGLVAVTVALAEASWRLVENPIRTRGFRASIHNGLAQVRGLVVRRPAVGWNRPGIVLGSAGLMVAAVVVLVAVSEVDPAPVDPSAEMSLMTGYVEPPAAPPADPADPSGDPTASATPDDHGATVPGRGSAYGPPGHVDKYTVIGQGPVIRRLGSKDPSGGSSGKGSKPPAEPRDKTSCTSVAYIGESTSLGLISPSYLPNPKDRIGAQLGAVGVRTVKTDILGARSIVETWHNQPNAQSAVDTLLNAGFSGCWIIAMGTNDSANQAVGGVHPYPERIDYILDRLKGQPVMWLTVKSLRSSGPYDNANMQAFDDALRAACDRDPDLRLFDWVAEVQDPWFISDGIHYTSQGYRERAHRIADALANAFPADEPAASSCTVSSS